MKRNALKYLVEWLKHPQRKPLIVRGARQVGKTWLVRELARNCSRQLMEINFERDPGYARYFEQSDPARIFDDLSLKLNLHCEYGDVLLFLDEIQASPEVLSKLRWFAEELPQLAVIAAGSLLEFALADLQYSMPVGRIQYMFIEPLDFSEFLDAQGQERLKSRLEQWMPGDEFSIAVHEKSLEWFERYMMVGGMPEIVSSDASGRPALDIRRLQRDLIQTCRDDFAKYSGRLNYKLLDPVMLAVSRSLGKKFVYSHVGEGVKQAQAKNALNRLAMSRLCQLIPHTAANGIPLGAQMNERIQKVAFLDVGLIHGLWQTPAVKSFPAIKELSADVRGSLCEQIVAQQLRMAAGSHFSEGQLFHWRREGGRVGEIDYLLELEQNIVPVEVKSGTTGAMKSLHQFMYDKALTWAIRIDRNPPSRQIIDLKTTQGNSVRYTLLNLPYYLVWRIKPFVMILQES